MPDNLKQLRERIDALDIEILKLVSERASAAHAIGKLKGDGTVYRPEREAQVLRRLAERNPGPLPEKAVTHLFTEVISACRALEDAFSVATLGPKGTFSEEAAVKHFGGQAPVLLCTSIDEVFRSVESGNIGYGVVPVENSTEGAVGRTLDLLLSTPLKICGEVLLPVHQNLLSKGSDISALKRIFSHAQSLAQCNRWLAQNCPRAERIPVASNAEAARMAQEDAESAAIAGRSAADYYGLPVVAGNIEDEPNNTTRFVVVSPQDVPPSGDDKTSLVMSTRNVPGAIHELLTPLAKNGVSMTRLESRPSRTGLWEYVFFLDMEGHQGDENVARALEGMRELAAFLKILGSYPVAVQ
ncbi:MAG: prephenate dehydratase [Betaproteobacteria bacterium]|nr:prephenate dehydratase [Betaproteobacteria bacterium]